MLKLSGKNLPSDVKEISQLPDHLFWEGNEPAQLLSRPRLAIVGSRKVSPYGRAVTARLAGELAEMGVVIVSGLALGVDAIAHQAAIEAGGQCLAILPSPLNNIVPVTNRRLAGRILESGGALVSEYAPGKVMQKQFFVARNRLVAAFGQAVLITEAGYKSGSLHTANFALEQGKDILAVPGNITAELSVGTNNLIKAGALVVTGSTDAAHALGLNFNKNARLLTGSNQSENTLLTLINQGINSGDELLQVSGLDISLFNQTLTMLEIRGKIRALGANHWAAAES